MGQLHYDRKNCSRRRVLMPREQDHFTRKAFQEGYPARSVYKLEEMDKRFGIFKSGGKVLDIGAAPGSWSMYAAKRIGGRGSVLAVDLLPEHPDLPKDRYTFVQGDAFSPVIRETITSAGPFTCILSDAAPSTTGNRTVDTSRSCQLVELLLDLAESELARGGKLIAKIFQGGDEGELLNRMKTSFQSARIYKPKASRKGSFEVFLLGTGYKGKDGG
jgi:23S rRNA (uridine2552-2'-O)-methyltransferase